MSHRAFKKFLYTFITLNILISYSHFAKASSQDRPQHKIDVELINCDKYVHPSFFDKLGLGRDITSLVICLKDFKELQSFLLTGNIIRDPSIIKGILLFFKNHDIQKYDAELTAAYTYCLTRPLVLDKIEIKQHVSLQSFWCPYPFCHEETPPEEKLICRHLRETHSLLANVGDGCITFSDCHANLYLTVKHKDSGICITPFNPKAPF